LNHLIREHPAPSSHYSIHPPVSPSAWNISNTPSHHFKGMTRWIMCSMLTSFPSRTRSLFVPLTSASAYYLSPTADGTNTLPSPWIRTNHPPGFIETTIPSP
jgi:hypothetical protein